MHIVIDILAGIILLFFFLAGWHKGFLLTLLGVVRVILAYGAAYLSGRYLGFWLGQVTHRPRLITVPVCAILTFVLIAFAFRIIMYEIGAHHQEKKKKDNFHLPFFSCLGGGVINLAGGTLSLALLFWLGDLFLAGVAGTSIPGADRAHFGQFARRTVYEASYFVIPKKSDASQAAAMARMISNPADGMKYLEIVIESDAVQQLVTDKQFAEDLLSGDAELIAQNASLQQLFDDGTTLDALRELGVISGYEKKSGLCEKLATFGQNEKIQSSIENLKAKQLLNTKNIPNLLRDPDFDIILCELIR